LVCSRCIGDKFSRAPSASTEIYNLKNPLDLLLFDLFRSVQLSKLVGQRMGTPITREDFDDFDELLRKMQPYLDETQVEIDDEGRYVVTGNNPMAAMLRCHDESGGLRAAIASYEGMLKPTFC
jgi:hypothetical protein